MKRILLVFVLSGIVSGVQAQQKKMDSLKKLIAAAKDDTSRVLLMNQFVKLYANSKPDSALLLYQQAELLSKNVQFVKGEAVSLNREGNALVTLGSYPKALTYYLAALKLNEQRGDRCGEGARGESGREQRGGEGSEFIISIPI